jgi:penicillin-binding protein 1A
MNIRTTTFWRKLIFFSWIGFFSFVGLLLLYIYLVSINFLNLFGPMPSLEALENPAKDQASIVYTSDGIELGKYFRENRNPIEYEDLSINLVNALQATEDYRFDDHSGIDLQGLVRVLFKSLILQQKNSGGGSTISQQLAKNLFNTRNKNYKGKIDIKPLNLLFVKTKEWITAVRLERSYTKKEIMTMYFNTVDFGSNAFGIKTASATFFSTSPDSLTIPQAAMLVGVLKAPTLYSPVLNPDNALERRNVVLDQLYKYNYVTRQTADSIKAQPIQLAYQVENHNTGLATYFRSVITDYLLNWSKERGIDLYTDGLKIYTTIDSRMQQHAEAAVERHMKDEQKLFERQWANTTPWRDEKGKEIPYFIEQAIKRTSRYQHLKATYGKDTAAIWKVLNTPYTMRIFTWKGEKDTSFSPLDSLKYYKRFLHAGLLSVEPQTGEIKAWVGGINHKYFKYDHVKQGARQPGSTFKPLVYATAIDHGYSPCYEVIDAPVTFETGDTNKTWSPKNSDDVFTNKPFTLRKAMANSINSVTARMIKEVTPQHVVDMAKRLGIESPLEAVPALCLGVNDVTIYEMVGAYSTFSNAGVWIEPTFITRIEDKNGNTIQNFVPKTREAINEESAYLMVHMLKGATEESGGTALGLNKFKLLGIGAEIGGKTGTTQNYSDGWFIGLVSKLTTGIWVGGEDRCIHLRGFNFAQGARTAMPIWAYYMQAIFEDPAINFKKERFKRPAKGLSVEIDCKRFVQKETSSRDSTFLYKVKQDLPDDF